MESDQDDRVVSLEREVATLRQRVAELQRREALHKDTEASRPLGGVEVSVSARPGTHELLEEAQAIAHLGNWTIDVATGKREWSSEFRRILGIDPDAPASEELLTSLIHPDDRTRLIEVRRSFLRLKTTAEAIELRVVRPNGDLRHVRVQAVARRGNDGVVHELRGTCLDVTEQVLLRQRLADAQKTEAIGRLAGGIAHDFNNLLTIVTLNLDLWARRQATAVPEIEDAQRAVSSARSLVQRLLAFSRQAQLDRRFVDPNDLVRQTLDLLRRVVGDDVQLASDLGVNLPTVRVDPSQIEQALVNLVVNARDAMSASGKVVVSTRLGAAMDGTPVVEIAVRDDGPGMEPEIVRRIFEPFFTTKEEGRGTGLGLATVLGTVEQHGGSVDVDSQPGRGTTFRIRLPVEQGTRSPSVFPIAKSPGPNRLPAATVMVVEDEPMVAAVIARVLERHGLTVLLAGRASEALALWEQHPEIDAVLCDVSMPEMRGPELLRALPKRDRPLRALFVTGYSDEKLEAENSQPVLTKPFLPDELIRAVSRLLGNEVV